LGENDRTFLGDILRYFLGETEENIKTALLSMDHGSQNILLRRVPVIIVGWFAARTCKIKVSGIRGYVPYCKMVVVYTAHNLQTQLGGPQVGDRWYRRCSVLEPKWHLPHQINEFTAE
jgi:hypothetical protein